VELHVNHRTWPVVTTRAAAAIPVVEVCWDGSARDAAAKIVLKEIANPVVIKVCRVGWAIAEVPATPAVTNPRAVVVTRVVDKDC
jgi:hypothetical protein